MRKNLIVLVLIFLWSCDVLWNQEKWVTTIGGSSTEGGTSIISTPDGGYIVTGSTGSVDGDFKGMRKGLTDVLVIKYDSKGEIQWKRTFGGSGIQGGYSITRTTDGGYVLTGFTTSNDGDFKGMGKGQSDIFVIKVDSKGNVLWKKLFGGTGNESGSSITTTSDGGVVLTGLGDSNDGDFEGMNKGVEDIIVLKLDPSGVLQWKKTIGGSDTEGGSSVTRTSDGGFVLSGFFMSNDVDFIRSNKGIYDVFVIKLNEVGHVVWSKSFGGSGFEQSMSMTTTPDGGCILTGRTNSEDGDFKELNKVWKRGGDVFVIKLNSSGDLQWKNTYGGSQRDDGNSITTSPDGGFIMSGLTTSKDGDINGTYNGQEDIWVIKLNERGLVEWEKTFGGKLTDMCLSVSSFPDGGCVLTGFTNSNDGDFKGMNKGDNDIFVIKLDSNGNLQPSGNKSKK